MNKRSYVLHRAIISWVKELADCVEQERNTPTMKSRLAIECSLAVSYSQFNQSWMRRQLHKKVFFVAGRYTWETRMGDKIKDGEKPMKILIPTPYKPSRDSNIPVREDPIELYRADLNEEKKFPLFNIGYVYSSSQIEDFHMPAMPKFFSHDKYPEANIALITLGKKYGINFVMDEKLGDIEAISHRDHRILFRSITGTKTLVHELAHQLLGHVFPGNTMLKQYKEYEAETVAYVVGRYFHWEVDSSVNYLIIWRATKQEILDCLRSEYLLMIAAEIIEAIVNN